MPEPCRHRSGIQQTRTKRSSRSPWGRGRPVRIDGCEIVIGCKNYVPPGARRPPSTLDPNPLQSRLFSQLESHESIASLIAAGFLGSWRFVFETGIGVELYSWVEHAIGF